MQACLLALCMVFGVLSGCGGAPEESTYYIEYLNKEKTAIVPVAYEPESTRCLLALCMVFGVLSGCGGAPEESTYYIEYLNKEKTAIVPVAYEPESTRTGDLIREFLAALCSDTDEVEYRKPVPSDVEITRYSLDGALLTLWFDADYKKMGAVEEVLCRAAVVRTMTQIKGVDTVNFYVEDAPLTDSHGNLIGSMSADSFVENPGEQINSIQNTALTLYFANETGDALVREVREEVYYSSNVSLEKLVMEQLLEGNSIQNTALTLYFANETGDALVREVREEVYYSSNVSLEKLVMEQLLEGPSAKGAKSAIPAGTKLVKVSVVDGVCYVSLDEGFRNQDYQVSEPVVIYSIVNSLCELPAINKVQISINGDTSGVYRDTLKLEDMYERNQELVEGDTSGKGDLEETGTEEE